MRIRGTVKWWSEAKGYGFLTPDDGTEDVFCHFTGIRATGNGRRNLTEGQSIEFDVIRGAKGDQASDVAAVSA